MKPGYLNRFHLKVNLSTDAEQELYNSIIQSVKRINSISIVAQSDVVQREINYLREQINDAIYRLYGLNDDEKRAIEKLVEPQT